MFSVCRHHIYSSYIQYLYTVLSALCDVLLNSSKSITVLAVCVTLDDTQQFLTHSFSLLFHSWLMHVMQYLISSIGLLGKMSWEGYCTRKVIF